MISTLTSINIYYILCVYIKKKHISNRERFNGTISLNNLSRKSEGREFPRNVIRHKRFPVKTTTTYTGYKGRQESKETHIYIQCVQHRNILIRNPIGLVNIAMEI